VFIPFQYQVSEYDCVPTAFMNAMSFLFHRIEIPPMVIRHIYLYSLDTVGRNARFGVGGTSKYAVRLLGNWLSSYKMKHFSVYTEFLEKDQVSLQEGNPIQACLEQGGVVLTNMLLTPREEHYVMITAIEADWVYCFDSYRRMALRRMQGNVKVLKTQNGREPNLIIKKSWLDQEKTQRFCFGPVDIRECLLIWRIS
jgi:hypothetical protein